MTELELLLHEILGIFHVKEKEQTITLQKPSLQDLRISWDVFNSLTKSFLFGFAVLIIKSSFPS